MNKRNQVSVTGHGHTTPIARRENYYLAGFSETCPSGTCFSGGPFESTDQIPHPDRGCSASFLVVSMLCSAHGRCQSEPSRLPPGIITAMQRWGVWQKSPTGCVGSSSIQRMTSSHIGV